MKCVLTNNLKQPVVNNAYMCLLGQKQTPLLSNCSRNLRVQRICKPAFIT